MSAMISPGVDVISKLAEQALADLPSVFREAIRSVPIRVQDFADDETLREMEIASPFDLMGLYRGVPIGHDTNRGAPEDVDMIFLYRRAILDYWCDSGEPLEAIVRHVLIHEIGHHFGLSDEDMERIEEAASTDEREVPV